MKTSKKLFISFLSLIGVLFIIVSTSTIKTIRTTDRNSSYYKKVETGLPSFNHIKVANKSCLEISESETGENCIVYSLPKDSIVDKIIFTLVDDTLILPFQNIRKKQAFKLKCGNIKSITCSVPLTIAKEQDTLSVYSKKGQIIIRSKHFDQLNLTGTGGAFRTIQSLIIDELNVDLHSTRLRFYNVDINKINAKAENNSEIVIQSAKEIHIKKDESCHLKEY